MKKEVKQRILDKKWATIEKVTKLTRPLTPKENAKRAREAHVDLNVVKYESES